MAKRQTRRSISLKGITYQRLKELCDSQGLSLSGYIEGIVVEHLDAENIPLVEEKTQKSP